MTHCAHCGRPIASDTAPVRAHTAGGSVAWCDKRCAAADGWPDDVNAAHRAFARQAIPHAAKVIPMPKLATSHELRIDIRIPLSGDMFAQAPTLAAIKPALDTFRAAIKEAGAEADITHQVVAPRVRTPRTAKAAAA